MKRRQTLLAALAWMVAALPAASQAAEADAALLAKLRQRLADAPVQSGEFEQRKTVKGFKHPLLSRGDYLVARERGVIWRTREPFASALLLTRDKLVSRDAAGAAVTTLDARQEPALRTINQMLFALLSADLDALTRLFQVEGQMHADGSWQLRLQPRDAQLARWLQGIALKGDRQVQTIEWQEASGDSSQIRFSHQHSADKLSSDEAARFD